MSTKSKKDGTRKWVPSAPLNLVKKRTTTPDKRDDDGENRMNKRVRTMPHIEGNWATFVYAAFTPSPKFEKLARQITAFTNREYGTEAIKFENKEAHISLNRMAYLKVFQIDRFVSLIKSGVSDQERFQVTFSGIRRYENDQKTRQFIGIDVHLGQHQLKQLVKAVDFAMASFDFPPFYEAPLFHCSIAWTTNANIPEDMPDQLKTLADQVRDEMISIEFLVCHIGDRKYKIKLKI